jgi:hypothetical protein
MGIDAVVELPDGSGKSVMVWSPQLDLIEVKITLLHSTSVFLNPIASIQQITTAKDQGLNKTATCTGRFDNQAPRG